MTDPGRCENCLAPKGKTCPFWIGTSHAVFEKNVSSGEQRLVTGCFPTVFMRLMEFVVHTNVSVAAASETVRNEIDRGFNNVHRVLDLVKDVEMLRMLEGAAQPTMLPHRKDDGQ